jgi:multicomponent Na+:H+ antiporter subunit E
MTRVVLVVWLTVLWVVLWRDLTVANVVSGMAVALAVATLYRVSPGGKRRHTIRPAGLAVFLGYFAWQLLVSNIVVARTIVSPRRSIRTGIIEVQVPGCSDLVTTIVADAITLTPGTMTVDVGDNPQALYVHVLTLDDVEAVRRDVEHLIDLVLRAFCTDELLEEIRQMSGRSTRSAHDADEKRDPQ